MEARMKLAFAVMMLTVIQIQSAHAQGCAGKPMHGVGGVKNSWALDGGGIAAFAKMNINLDGYGHTYSPENYEGGALLHVCNAGKVYLPDGSSYQGSESNATCSGRFMQDFKRIGGAGWQDSSVGAIKLVWHSRRRYGDHPWQQGEVCQASAAEGRLRLLRFANLTGGPKGYRSRRPEPIR